MMALAEAMEFVDPLIGQLVANRYEVVRLIDRGGMGAVYEVRHRNLNRSFAMKTLAPDLVGDPGALARFRREAEIIAGLRHPNIVDAVDWDTLYDGSPCMVMAMLRGEDLWDYLNRRGPLPWHDIARIGDQILSALVVAHKAGVVHRDIKPQNIFVHVDDSGDEHAMLLDFGISKLHHSRTLSGTGTQLLGTPTYMAPEQADGRGLEVGPAADVWAVGAILYEMATGQEAFGGDTLPSILYRICNHDPTPIRDLRADTPPRFERLVARALSRDPDTRIRTACDLRAGLRTALHRSHLRALRKRRHLDLTEPSVERSFSPLATRTECVYGAVPMAEPETFVEPKLYPSSDERDLTEAFTTTFARGTRPEIRAIDSGRGPARRRRDPAVVLAAALSVIALVLLAAWLSPPESSAAWPPAAPMPAAEPAAQMPATEPAADPSPARVIDAPAIVIDLPAPEPNVSSPAPAPQPEQDAPAPQPEQDAPAPQPEQDTPAAQPEQDAPRAAPRRGAAKRRRKPHATAHPTRRGPRRKAHEPARVERVERVELTTPAAAPPSAQPAPPTALPDRPSASNVSDWTRKLRNAAHRCGVNTGTRGRIDLTMRVAPSGSVADAHVDGGSPAFAQCLGTAARRARFAESRDGITVGTKYLVHDESN